MSTTFGRLGRAFLLLTLAVLVLAAAVALLVPGVSSQLLALIAGILASTLGILGVVFVLVQNRMFGSLAAMRRIEAHGRPTVATVTEITGSSGQINGNPILRVVWAIDGQQVRRSVVVPVYLVHTMRPGLRLPVKVDPLAASTFVVDWSGSPGAARHGTV